MEKDKEIQMRSRYTFTTDGSHMMRSWEENGIRVARMAANMTEAKPQWGFIRLCNFMARCVREVQDETELKFDDPRYVAEMLAFMYQKTANESKRRSGSHGLWMDIAEYTMAIVADRERVAGDIKAMGEECLTKFPRIQAFMNGTAGEDDTMAVFLSMWIQMNLMAGLDTNILSKIPISEKDAARWMFLKREAAGACSLLEQCVSKEAGGKADLPSEPDELTERCRTFLSGWDPESIYEYLDGYISGQEAAKTEFAQLCYEHVARIANLDLGIKKSNHVMFGPTGCGKTELARVMRSILPVPIEIVDSSVITNAGFKGSDKTDVMFELAAGNPNIEYGIVILDEFDKLCMPSHDSTGADVHRLVQGELLKMIEGTTLRRSTMGMSDELDTTNITFICAGAFEGAFDNHISRGLGFGSCDTDLNSGRTTMKCLEDFGMIPELAGRICSVIALDSLDEDDLYEILAHKKDNCIENMQKLFRAAYAKEVEFSDSAMREICRSAVANGLGARGLNGIVESVCHAGRSTAQGKGVLHITDDMVRRCCMGA